MKKKVIIISLLLAAILLISPCSAWLPGYTYRQMHNITGCSTWTSNQSNFQMNFFVFNTTGVSFNDTAYTNGRSQSSWYDLRFTDLSDTEYDYWIETTNATMATVWVEIPNVANSTSINTSLYMYYGNPLASEYSNVTNTMNLYDGFDGAALNTSMWTRVTAGTTTATVASGYLRLASNSGNSHYQHMYSLTTYGYNIATEYRYSESAARYISTIGFWSQNTSALYNPAVPRFDHLVAGGYSTNSQLETNVGSTALSSNEVASTWYRGSGRYGSNYQEIIRDGVNVAFRTDALTSTSYYTGVGEASAFSAACYIDIDWIAIRKYIYPYPVNLWWGEEEYVYRYIQFDRDSYALGETANITTAFPSEFWDTPNYTYFFYLFKSTDLSTPVDTVPVTLQTQSHYLDTADYGAGTYYAMLYLTHVGTGYTYFVDYDYADFVNGVTLSGIVFNATSGASLSGATVDVTQGGATSSYISTLAGYATTNPLNVGQAITVDGSLAGYTPYTSTFTPLGAANITKAIPLVSTTTACYWTVAANSTSLTGLVDELPYYVPANGAYLNLSNATWYSNITLGLTGWYLFEDLENSSAYTLIAGKSGFNDYSASVTSGADNLTWYNFTLGAAFDLTVYVKDAASGAPLTSNVTIEITNSTGSSDSETTTTGSATFTDLAGSWDISVVCVGYTEGTATVNMDADKSVTISLSTPVIPNVYYTPHDVKMVVQDAYGNPIDGATMTITPISTTLDSWDWLQSVLGIPAAAAADTTVQTGTTDYMGSATFVLVKEIQYQIDIVSVADDVDDTFYLYPKDDMYIFTVGVLGGYENPVNPVTNMSWAFTNTTHNATYENLTFTYTDSGSTTTNVSFWVKSHASPVTVVYQTYCADPNNCNEVYTAAASNGEEYYVGADITCADGSCYQFTQAFAFQKLVNLGISSAYYPWIAAAFLIVIGAIFSVISVRFGAVLVPIFAWMFFYMKWLTLTWQQTALLTILLVIGVFAYIRKQEDKVGG